MSGNSKLGWWTISGEDLLDMLRRCREGEDPDLVYMEAYANSEREQVPPKPVDRMRSDVPPWLFPPDPPWLRCPQCGAQGPTTTMAFCTACVGVRELRRPGREG